MCQRKLGHIRVEIWFTKEIERNRAQMVYKKHKKQDYFGH